MRELISGKGKKQKVKLDVYRFDQKKRLDVYIFDQKKKDQMCVYI